MPLNGFDLMLALVALGIGFFAHWAATRPRVRPVFIEYGGRVQYRAHVAALMAHEVERLFREWPKGEVNGPAEQDSPRHPNAR